MSKDHSSRAVDKNDRKLALVIVDAQKKFIAKGKDTTLESVRAHTPTMLKAIDMFRDAGRPVIWILFEGDTLMEGITEDTMALLDGFEIKESDHVVIKYHMNSFNNTNLSDIIHHNGCDAAVFTGMFAQYCVMATYWGAFDRDVSPYMLKDGLISSDEKFCDLAYGLCKTYDLDELESNLRLHRM
jgi:nicotinamidase-related amidase